MVLANKRVRASLLAALLTASVAGPAQAQLSTAPPPITTYDGDPGRAGDPASWRTPEFLRDNGMLSISAEFAYAAGYSGTGMNIGVVDSGTFEGHMREHGSKATNYAVGDRYHAVVAQGGDTGPTSGYYNQLFNDLHGTHVTGTIGASRDGVGETTPAENMHGVAFNADLYVGNTGKTDGVLYGKWPANVTAAQKPDNAYIGNVYRAVNAQATADGKPIRLITSSWGSQPNTENYGPLEPAAGNPSSYGLNTAWRYLSLPEGVADPDGNTSHWLNGAIDVARTGTIIQFTAGNSGYVNPTPRGAAPYYMPELEGRWYTTSGINPGTGRTLNADGSVLVPGTQEFNQCGVAKWSCVTAPSRNINSTVVTVVNGVPQPRYGSASGTSMAGPHSAAELALIMKRFPYMTNTQALYTLFTNGRQNATIGNPAVQNPDRGKAVQVPDARNGWHTPNLRDAFKGPGQLLGPTVLDTQGYSDTWSNDISDVAIRARKGEDEAEAAAWAQTKADKGWTNGLPANAGEVDRTQYETGTRREAARNARVYTGSLTKQGEGTLTLSGNNTYTGTTTVAGGTLAATGSLGGDLDVTAAGTFAPGNGARVGGNARLAGRTQITLHGSADYGSLRADGDVVLSGPLTLDIQGPLTPGTKLTLVKGKTLTGTFAGLPEGTYINQGGYWLWVSYLGGEASVFVAATTTVSGTVPATLALTLGAPANFGAFTPGVAKEYTASTTATVLSTAGDATLTVADPSPTATGHLVNGAFTLPQPLQGLGVVKTWSAPTSNEVVPVTFKQAIGAGDPVRTGTYAKTLTFTLSTTNP
ncbi:S8 family peptidase [Solirubrobacter soli]|uniref:S8 family peptidase n=1 Tax=Solirubrobacter soli TaxID=363832 RepID=UPI000402DF9B|nr:S8 family peptidase [Solirubrobacter soli]